MEETHCSTKHPQILLSDHAFQNDTSHYHSHASNIPVYFPSVIKSIIFVFGILYVYIFTILTKSPSWSSLLPIVLRTRRGAMRSRPTLQHPLKIHGGGQVNTANLMFSSRELATTALYLITPFEQGTIILSWTGRRYSVKGLYDVWKWLWIQGTGENVEPIHVQCDVELAAPSLTKFPIKPVLCQYCCFTVNVIGMMLCSDRGAWHGMIWMVTLSTHLRFNWPQQLTTLIIRPHRAHASWCR